MSARGFFLYIWKNLKQMNCLTNYIGLRSCTVAEPLSGLYINDYPGMTMELLEQISNPEQNSYAGFWESTQNIAFQRLKRDVQNALYISSQVQLNQVLFQTSKQFVQQWQSVNPLAPSEQFRGVFLSVRGSKYLGMRLKELYIFNSGNVTLEDVPYRIVQTQDGKILKSGTMLLAVGMNYIPINQTFYSDFDKINIAILVDCTNLPTLSGNFVDYGWDQMDFECASAWTYVRSNGFIVFPVTAGLDYVSGNNWRQDNSQSGVYCNAELICSLDSFICQQKEWLLDAWANLLCYHILWAKSASPRSNFFAQSNREFTERSMATFLDGYTNSMNLWGKQLNLRGEDLCFDCSEAALIQQGFTRP
jgi:hypothetical protein